MKLVNQTIASFAAKALTKNQQGKINGGTGNGSGNDAIEIPGGRTSSSTTTTDVKKG